MSDSDPLVVFSPSGKRGRVPSGTSILEAARMLGVDLDSVCGGRGICSRCQVLPSFGTFPKLGISVARDSISAWNQVEERFDRIRGLPSGRRLGCQARILDNLAVDVPPESQVHRQVVRKSADTRPVSMDPAVRLYYVEVEPPHMDQAGGDLERLEQALRAQWQLADVRLGLAHLTRLQGVLREGDWKITLAIHRDHNRGSPRVVELWPGFFGGPLYGLAIDVGSTTIAAHLCNLEDGSVTASAGIMNPQIRFGEDLMSRVSYAMLNQTGAADMTSAVRIALCGLIQSLTASIGADEGHIVEAVFVCNPIIHHLLLGIDPVELGQAPFTLATDASVQTLARDLELVVLGEGVPIHVLPCIAGHVGADAAAVILSEQPHESPDRVLIVDVGTNAEIVFGDRQRVLACSSPTGPAFEGAQISAGQRASPGAIERVEVNPRTLEPRFKVVGCDLWSTEEGFANATIHSGVTGICGSGIIEAVAELRMAGVIDKSGLIGRREDAPSARVVADGRTCSYVLHRPRNGGAAPIKITQADVRAIQLAKSALYAGAKLLMDHLGSSRVDRIVLAGAFGAHISPKHAMVLGMIPDCKLDNVSSSGNAAGTGARLALCNLKARAAIEATVHKIEKVETAIEPRFQEHFVNANALPHAVDSFEHLSSVVDLPDVSHNIAYSRLRGGARRRRRR